MKLTPMSIAVVGAVALASCGSEDTSELSDVQADAVDAAIESAADDGIELERSCVEEVAAQLSDEDAALAATDGDATLSAEGEALSLDLINCADDEQLVDFFVTNLEQSGTPFDEDCAREELQDLDLKALIATTGDGGDPPPEFVEALTRCFEP